MNAAMILIVASLLCLAVWAWCFFFPRWPCPKCGHKRTDKTVHVLPSWMSRGCAWYRCRGCGESFRIAF